MDALFESSRPIRSRQRRRSRRRGRAGSSETRCYFALQTWLLFFIAITTVQIIMSSYWVPAITNSIVTTDRGMITRSTATSSKSSEYQHGEDSLSSIIKKDTDVLRYRDYDGTSNSEIDNADDDSAAANNSADDVFYSETRNADDETIKDRDKVVAESDNKKRHTKHHEDRKKETSHGRDERHKFDKSKGQSTNSSQTINKEVALDNYYSREHINKSVARKRATNKPILVVGGSDGSGTRAFVDMLIRMGVLFVVDDKGTKDVHGQEMFNGGGWPPLAKMVLEVTHSADYEIHDLPKKVRDQAIAELKKLKKKLDSKASAIRKDKRDKKKKDPTVEDWAQLINYGFKAPVTMLLLPLLRQVFGPIKFLHVVRDGRDMALSNNISPVVKFYDSYYKDSVERRAELEANNGITNQKDMEHVLSMHLWNDWNTEVLSFNRNHTNGKSFDYLVVRTEDFVHPETKYEQLLRLSDFVGSHKKDDELCCLSREAVEDMGVSVRTAAQNYKKKEQQSQSKHPKGGGGGLGSVLREEEEALDKIAKTLEEEVKSIRSLAQALHAQEETLVRADNNNKILEQIFSLLDQMDRGDKEYSDSILTDGSEGDKDTDHILDKLLGTPTHPASAVRVRGSRDLYVNDGKDEEKDKLIGEIFDALKGPKRNYKLPSRHVDDDDAYRYSDDILEDLLAGLMRRKRKRIRQSRYRYMDDHDEEARGGGLGELLTALQRPKKRHSRTRYAEDEDVGTNENLRAPLGQLTRPSKQPAPRKELRKRKPDIIDDDFGTSLIEKLGDLMNSANEVKTKHIERDEDDLAALLRDRLGNRRLSESEFDEDEDVQGIQSQRRRHLFSSHLTRHSTRHEGNSNHLKGADPVALQRRLASVSFKAENPARRRLTATDTTLGDDDLVSNKRHDTSRVASTHARRSSNSGQTHETANEPISHALVGDEEVEQTHSVHESQRRKQKERQRSRHREDNDQLLPHMKRSHGNHRESVHTPHKSSRDDKVDLEGDDDGGGGDDDDDDEVARSRAFGFAHHKGEYEDAGDDDDHKKYGSTTSTEEETRRVRSSNKMETRKSRGERNGEQDDAEDVTIHQETMEESVRSNMSKDALLDSNLVESTSRRHGESIERDHGKSDIYVSRRRKQSSNHPAKERLNVESIEQEQGSSATAISSRRKQTSSHPTKRRHIGRDSGSTKESDNLAERGSSLLHEELDHGGGNGSVDVDVYPPSEKRKPQQHTTKRKPRAPPVREQAEQDQMKEEQLEEEWNHAQNEQKQVAQDWEAEQQARRQQLQQRRQAREEEIRKRREQLKERRQNQHDQHTHGAKPQRDQRKKVEGRFGKWIAALKDQPELSALLHAEGAQGLKLFGYEPSVRFSDESPGSCKCDEAVVCDAEKEPQQPKPSKTEQPPKSSPLSFTDLSEKEIYAAQQILIGDQEQDQIIKELEDPQQQLDSEERQRLEAQHNFLEEREEQYMKTFSSDKEILDALVLVLKEEVSSLSGDPEAQYRQMEKLRILQGYQRKPEASQAKMQQEVIQQIRELEHQQTVQKEVTQEIFAEINDKSHLDPTRRQELFKQVQELNDLQNNQISLMEDLQERLRTLREQEQEEQRPPVERQQSKEEKKLRKEEEDIIQHKLEEQATQRQTPEAIEIQEQDDNNGYLQFQDGDEYGEEDNEHHLVEASSEEEEKQQSHPAQAPKVVSPSNTTPSPGDGDATEPTDY